MNFISAVRLAWLRGPSELYGLRKDGDYDVFELRPHFLYLISDPIIRRLFSISAICGLIRCDCLIMRTLATLSDHLISLYQEILNHCLVD